MNNFKKFQSMTFDELADWLDKYGAYDYSIWGNWFDDNYCSKCEPIGDGCYGNDFAWCELNGKCKYFQEFDMIPSNKQVIKMWLELESDIEVGDIGVCDNE